MSNTNGARSLEGFLRVAAAIPPVRVGAVMANAAATLDLWREAHAAGVNVAWFPELGLTGYTAGDLHLDQALRRATEAAIAWLVERVRDERLAPLAFLGAPVWCHPGIYNCAVAIHHGRVLGVVPKAFLPTYGEFYEARHFRHGRELPAGAMVTVGGVPVPFGLDLVFDGLVPGADDVPVGVVPVGVEVCEDGWVATTPAARLAGAGALAIGNLSGSPFSLGKGEDRRLTCWKQSAPNLAAYVYVGAGPGESSSDLAFDAHALVYEAGRCLAESRRFARDPQLVVADVDVDALRRARARTGTFGDAAVWAAPAVPYRRVPFLLAPGGVRLPLRRRVDPAPFVPSDPALRATRCWEVFEIQSNALVTRMRHFGNERLVLALSGGRDSTLAALACVQALDLSGLPRANLACVSMPGWGTSATTRDASRCVAEALGATFVEEPIDAECELVLGDQGHPAIEAWRATGTAAPFARFLGDHRELADVALENVQARVRKLRVLTRANRTGALEVGTGDLSEKALGWSTYAGDQVALYDVNCGVPKTLVSAVIRWVADERAALWSAGDTRALRVALDGVLAAPITPELVPPGPSGEIVQLTEATLGPFAVHDFYLDALVGQGARPSRAFALAQVAFAGTHDPGSLREWLRTFLVRFFRAQWKRDATPDGPKVLPVALSPRGDWRMPSDAVPDAWLADLDAALALDPEVVRAAP